jgi:RNA polymerase sigma-70 factor (ECF subfamily)
MRGVGSRAERPRGGEPPSELRSVYEDEVAYVWNSVRSLGVREADLEDVTHDVFIKAFHTYGGYDRSRPRRPWLFGIAMRVASDYRELAHHRREAPELAHEPPDERPGSETALGDEEERKLLLAALDDLSWERRALVVMFYLNGHTIDEIAEVFPAPKFTLYSRLRAARADLREAMLSRGGGRP